MSEKKPFSLYILAFLMVFMGLMAILGGVLLSIKPDGSLMKIPVSDLANTLFPNFLIPGLLLLILIGILPLPLTYALFARPRSIIFKRLNLYPDMAWPWSWAVYYGLLLVLWIIIEIHLVGYHTIVQAIVAVWGVVIVALALLPGIRKYFSNP
jgi:hypothetical protein